MESSKSKIMVVTLLLILPIFSQGVFAANPANSKASVTFTEGALTLEEVPEINFGPHTFTNSNQDYTAETVTPDLTVTDDRSTATGWNVTVKASDFTCPTIPADKMLGASITFDNGAVSQTPLVFSKPDPVKPFTVEANSGLGVTKVVSAQPSSGQGTWKTTWVDGGSSSVTLHVAGGSMKLEAFQSTLTWTLSDTPTTP